MMVSAKHFAAVLLLLHLFFLYTPPTTAEIPSPATLSETPAPSSHSVIHSPSFNKTCSLYSILKGNCDPEISSVYFAFSIVYLSFLLLHWISVCSKTKPDLRTIHHLMGALILIKALNLMIYAAQNNTTATATATATGLLFYFSKVMSVLHFSIVIHLIVSGWYFMNPFMQQLDKIILMILIPVHIFANIVNEWIVDVNEMLWLLDIISSCVVLLPLICAMISEWRDITEDDYEDDYRLSGLRNFYFIVMVNLMSMNVLRANSMVFELEIISLVFYMVMCYLFRIQFVRMHQYDRRQQRWIDDLQLSNRGEAISFRLSDLDLSD